MIQCWNCLRFYSVVEKECPYCNSNPEITCTSDEECDIETEESCINCAYYEPPENIVCKVLAKNIKWERPDLEIDEPSAFKCGKWRRYDEQR